MVSIGNYGGNHHQAAVSFIIFVILKVAPVIRFCLEVLSRSFFFQTCSNNPSPFVMFCFSLLKIANRLNDLIFYHRKGFYFNIYFRLF